MYYIISTLDLINLFLVLIIGCLFSQNQCAGSYFAMVLFARFYCISSELNIVKVMLLGSLSNSDLSLHCFMI